MIEELTADHVFAEVLLMRTAYRGAIVVVEGPTDKALYMRFLSVEPQFIIPAYGKRTVEAAVVLCDNRPVAGVVGIVDSDAESSAVASTNIVETGVRDADVLVLTQPTVVAALLTNWLASIDSVPDLDALVNEVIDTAVKLSMPISLLRHVNRREDWGLRLRGFPLTEVIDSQCRHADRDRLIELAIQRTKECGIPADIIEVALERCEKEFGGAPLVICRGHDLADVLAMLMNRRLGSVQTLGHQMLARLGRMAFGWDEWMPSQLHSSLTEWERSLGYSVCRQRAS
jgi:hypothetical protein